MSFISLSKKHLLPLTVILCSFTIGSCHQQAENRHTKNHSTTSSVQVPLQKVDTTAYLEKIKSLANGDTSGLWPVKHQPFPLAGAILPFKRIVAFYGNLYSKKMGILGELPPKELWQKLDSEVQAWEKADPSTPVQPAIHYIAVVGQGIPLKSGNYSMRMPFKQIDSVLTIAKMGHAIVFLDIQVGHSIVEKEVPLLEKYLMMPQVNLAIDPEFSMKDGSIPGRKIGSLDANDINYCSNYLAQLVQKYHLPPKILIIHRFTQGMVKNYKEIVLRPEVQIVMNMDGWGEPSLKMNTYKQYIYRQPVQFTGFKLFYKNDLKKPPHRMLTPEELLKLKPQPVYIQYQ
ncbi:MAG: hypothetical protein ACP5F6_02225 [Microbacter sp.]